MKIRDNSNKNRKDFADLLQNIKYPVLTPKSLKAKNKKEFVFVVSTALRKPELKELFSKFLSCSVASVRSAILPQKSESSTKKQKSSLKKVWITLKGTTK